MKDKTPSLQVRRLALIGAGLALLLAVAILLAGRTPEFDRWAYFGHYPRKWVALSLGFVWLAVGASCVARSRRTVFGFVFAHLLLGFGVALVEAAGLLGIVTPPSLYGGLGYEAKPNLDVKAESHGNLVKLLKLEPVKYPIHYKTDRRGYRCGEDRAVGEVRLWCVGDSFVVAGLVPWEETVTARLEAKLAAPAANVALTGTGPQRQRDMLREVAPRFEGRLVIQFVFEGNDLKDSARYRNPPPERRGWITPWALGRLGAQALPPPVNWGTWRGRRYHFWESTGDPRPELQHVVATLEEVREQVQQGGGTYAVAFFPTKLRAMGHAVSWPERSTWSGYGAAQVGPFPEQLAAALRAKRISFLDLTPALKAAVDRGVDVWFADDTHLNGAGHEVVTQALLAWDAVRGWSLG